MGEQPPNIGLQRTSACGLAAEAGSLWPKDGVGHLLTRTACALLLGALVACSRQPEVAPTFTQVAHVKVDSVGDIFLNGKPATLDDLRSEFGRLKTAGGAVQYYRPNPSGEPPPRAMEVLQAIIDAKVPVQLMENDFTNGP